MYTYVQFAERLTGYSTYLLYNIPLCMYVCILDSTYIVSYGADPTSASDPTTTWRAWSLSRRRRARAWMCIRSALRSWRSWSVCKCRKGGGSCGDAAEKVSVCVWIVSSCIDGVRWVCMYVSAGFRRWSWLGKWMGCEGWDSLVGCRTY